LFVKYLIHKKYKIDGKILLVKFEILDIWDEIS